MNTNISQTYGFYDYIFSHGITSVTFFSSTSRHHHTAPPLIFLSWPTKPSSPTISTSHTLSPTLIPVKLDIKTPNYQIWSRFFLITVGCFALTDLLQDHERSPNISPDDWTRGDYLLQSWIYSTISTDLSSMILSKTASAPELWKYWRLYSQIIRIIVRSNSKNTSNPLKGLSLSIHE